MRAECGRLGTVDKLRIFKNHPEGVISIKFKEAEAAQKCIQLMNGRYEGGDRGRREEGGRGCRGRGGGEGERGSWRERDWKGER